MKFTHYFEFRDGTGSVLQERILTGDLGSDFAFFEPPPLELTPPAHAPNVRGGIQCAIGLATLVRQWLMSAVKPAGVPGEEHWHFQMRRLAEAAGREICLALRPRRSPWLRAALENCGQHDQHLWPVDAAQRGMPCQFVPVARVRYLAAYMLHSVLERSGYLCEFESLINTLPEPRLTG